MPRPSTNSRKADRGRATPVAPLKRAKSGTGKLVKAKPNGSAAPSRASRNGRSTDRRTERVVQSGKIAGSDAAAAVSRGKYVYCIIESGDPLRFGPIGIG